MTFSPQELHDLPDVLSAPRFATYLAARGGDKQRALSLYQWNMEVSCAFLAPFQICEVGIRNAIAEGIQSAYGQNWTYVQPFRIALPNPAKNSPRRELQGLADRLPTTGKIIAELKFYWWQRMFKATHDNTIWNPYLFTVLPHLDTNISVQQHRGRIYGELDKIRKFRNRIAHHEPVFHNNLQEEYDRVRRVIGYRSETAANWLDRIEKVSELLANQP